ncbi:hypothetical protein, partial [Pseudomonas viridiflava]|uniref:hypothetical protein n=1 Tax=Pseudomonas viridiflava TaxID=33069 RepID=UPI0013D098A1
NNIMQKYDSGLLRNGKTVGAYQPVPETKNNQYLQLTVIAVQALPFGTGNPRRDLVKRPETIDPIFTGSYIPHMMRFDTSSAMTQ